jgi:serine/threonine protein kinase
VSPPQPPRGYRIVRALGTGAYKEVFAATNVDTGERVALKRYRFPAKTGINPKDLLVNFTDLTYSHRNLVPSHRIATSWIAEPLLNTILKDRLTPERRLPLAKLLRLFDGYLQGLAFLHENGVVHGDIKPHNMGIRAGTPVLLDFGIASFFARKDRAMRDYPGTLRTRPPELNARGVLPTKASDVWMMCATLLALLTGSYPFLSEKHFAGGLSRAKLRKRTAAAIRRGEHTLRNRILRSVQPRWLALLLCHGLRFDPALRITAKEILRCIADEEPAPERLLQEWRRFREVATARAINDRNDRLSAGGRERFAEVRSALKQILTRICTSDDLPQEYLFEGLASDDPVLVYHCYLALRWLADVDSLDSATPFLAATMNHGTYTGRTFARILAHYLRSSSVTRRDLVAFYTEHAPDIMMWGDFVGHTITLPWPRKDFFEFLDQEFRRPANRETRSVASFLQTI